MIVVKPPWVCHGRLSIFSIDIHPDGSRFATAGGDQKVRIWSMVPLVDKEAETDLTTPKALATLCDHFAAVNVVRWSRAGRYIASGSDDHIVFVYERRPGSGTVVFGSREKPDVENWKAVITLRGHTADVVDLAWCPDDSLLVSCSLDNTLRVWSMPNGGIVAHLAEHRSLVKGVAWDPIGSFVASQSDDKSVIIWNTSDWSLHQKVEGPYQKTVGCTFFRRLAFSPCGHFLTTTHAYEPPSHTAAVLERGDEWSKVFDFVGHGAPVVVVRYNHCMFRKQGVNLGVPGTADGTAAGAGPTGAAWGMQNGGVPGPATKEKGFGIGGNTKVFNCIAIGSQDCKVSVWTTNRPKPVMIGKHFFSQPVVDLAWSPDGYTLLCCSTDGTIAVFKFEESELGVPLTAQEMDEVKRERYGDTRLRNMALAESPMQLVLEKAAPPPTPSVAVNSVGAAGRADQVEGSSSLKTMTAIGGPTAVAATTVPPSDPVGNGAPLVGASSLSTVSPNGIPPRGLGQVRQMEYRRADGRKVIIPEPLLPPPPSVPDSVVAGSPRRFGGVDSASAPATGGGQLGGMGGAAQVMRASDADGFAGGDILGEKRGHPEDSARGEGLGSVKRMRTEKSLGGGLVGPPPPPPAPPATRGMPFNNKVPEAGMPIDRISASAPTVVSVPGGRSETLTLCLRDDDTDDDWDVEDGRGGRRGESRVVMLEARPVAHSNHTGTFGGGVAERIGLLPGGGKAEKQTEVVCSSEGSVRWRDWLDSAPVAIAGNTRLWAVACRDGSLQVYSPRGRRLLPCVVLDSPVAFMDCNSNSILLALTRAGMVHVWDIKQYKRILQESVCPVLRCEMDSECDDGGKQPGSGDMPAGGAGTAGGMSGNKPQQDSWCGRKVVRCHLSRAGAPVIVLDNRHAYVFHMAMCCWIRVADKEFLGSEFMTSWVGNGLRWGGGVGVGADTVGEVGELQAGVASVGLWSRNARMLGRLLEREDSKQATRAHLETMLASALALQSPQEYKSCLLAYVRHLTREGDEGRLREVCEDLFGMPSSSAHGPAEREDAFVLGMRKRHLLRNDVLPVMAGNRKIQRLLNEFLDLVTDMEPNLRPA
ncbi:hypothetical protein CBR_g60059 [Chara braunii]|uniref:Protein HIRA n=1 Tax=Chara braunii TaxID=69332 RepID=A0A388K8R3_CHABU|nr:hypothetical protein CBR_g60059 [Chara braunii]|eukprot:GBG66406.1 hypothetical protein CBR_g60059 [Chara braunii]